ncbi:DegT/DnrJ/EryC1/StrS family aminotransferase [Phytoactinopolyspora halotolerans]|uniref:DegT/DnrJ/EryC1/StrS family aminotransferase n=1 Tax=Phytoactinopolyspora halotolerans TaxID=1981512 RepID=A0A6L9SJR7_9ACTN|nr:DegT/DnrJ/EryC1/StrS family aminotransferase [Phytoactinopolyspora halotolerans]NEE04642.1 DegT/DnrJ/EryC1/StrS family aminotransferase [Phytoactinopolyspora halotolerans]
MSAELAIDGGRPVRTEPFPAWPVSGDEEARALAAVLASGRWGSTSGEAVREFERAFADYQQAEHCVAVCNGTLGLTAALKALGVGIGDEVVMPAYTFIGSATAALMIGAVPVFADVDAGTHLLDPAAAEAAITERTAAIMPVHLAGQPCDMDAFADLGRRRGLAVIEDAAQAHGAEWRGRRVGALGDAGMFSFQTSKNMTSGEGGAVVANAADVGRRLYAQANVGRVPDGGWYQHEQIAFNLRLTEFQGAILREQLRRHPEQTRRRTAVWQLLTELLADVPGIEVPHIDERVTAHGRHLFTFRVAGLGGAERKTRFVRALAAEGIPVSGGYVGLHRNEAIRNEIHTITTTLGRPQPISELPATEHVVAEAMWLSPQTLLGTAADAEDIATAIRKVLKHSEEL